MGNSGASYRDILVAKPFQEAGRLARHQMFVTGCRELQSKPFRRKLLLWFASCSLIKLSLEERRPGDLHPLQPREPEEGFFTAFIDRGAGAVEFAPSRR